MSDGSDNGSDNYPADTSNAPKPTGESNFKTADAPHSQYSAPSDHGADGPAHCGGIIDMGSILDAGGLAGGPGSLIDVELGKGDGHKAAILDLVVGGDDIAAASVLGGEIFVGVDTVGPCGLLDGLFDDCSFLS